MNLKRLTMIVMSLILVVGFVVSGCQSTASTSATNASSTTISTTATPTTSAPAEPVKLVCWVGHNIEAFPKGQDENNNIFIDFLRERTGYDLEWMIGPSEGEAQQFSLMMTAGNTPDLAYLTSKSMFSSYSAQGLLTSLNDALELFGHSFLASTPESTWIAVSNEAGQIHAIPLPQNMDTQFSTVIRKDWLDKLDLDIPTTTDDLADVLRAVIAAKPAGENTIGWATLGADSAFNGMQTILGAFGVATSNVDKNGVYMDKTIRPEMKDCLEYMAMLYAEGLIDPDHPVNKWQNVQEKFTSGLAFMAEIGWGDAKTMFPATEENNPGAECLYIKPVAGPKGLWGIAKFPPVKGYFIVPIHNADKVNNSVDFMQKFTDTEILKFISYGPEGEYFDLVDGVYFPKDNAAEIGYQVYYNFWDTVDNFHNRVKYKGFWPYYSAIMGWATYEELYNYAPPLERVENIVTSGRDLFGEYFIKIITGALPLSAWDEYVALRQADGGAERDAAIQDWYDANLKNK